MPSHEHPLAFAWRRLALQRRFRRKLGYRGNFEAPRSHDEKVQFRKLYGNHATYAAIADKYAARDHVRRRVGEQYLVPLYAVCPRLTPELVAGLPQSFVAKATHGCKWQRIVREKSGTDTAELIAYLNSKLGERFGRRTGELHYSFIPPRILVEQLLQHEDGSLPCDYYFYCYHTSRGFDYAIAIAAPEVDRQACYDQHWNVWNSTLSAAERQRYERPAGFPQLVEVARELSAGFDFLRVDLYSVEGRIYFGELTATPSAGFTRVTNPLRAAHRADAWEIAGHDPRLYTRRPS